jgi:hypothetical protein
MKAFNLGALWGKWSTTGWVDSNSVRNEEVTKSQG